MHPDLSARFVCRACLELRIDLWLIFHPLAQLGDHVMQPNHLGLQLHRLSTVCGLQRIQVALDAFFKLKLTLVSVDLALRVV